MNGVPHGCLLIHGDWVDRPEHVEVTNPVDDSVMGTTAWGTADDADRAADAADGVGSAADGDQDREPGVVQPRGRAQVHQQPRLAGVDELGIGAAQHPAGAEDQRSLRREQCVVSGVGY